MHVNRLSRLVPIAILSAYHCVHTRIYKINSDIPHMKLSLWLRVLNLPFLALKSQWKTGKSPKDTYQIDFKIEAKGVTPIPAPMHMHTLYLKTSCNKESVQ